MRSFRLLSLLALAGGVTLSACDSLLPEDGSVPTSLTFSPTSVGARLTPGSGATETIRGAGKAAAVSVSIREVAKVAPLVVNGVATYANYIQISQKKAYVAYITPGNAFGGGVDVIDASNPLNVSSTQSIARPDLDVSSVSSLSGGTVYFAGAVDLGSVVGTMSSRSILAAVKANDLTRTTNVDTLSSGNATDVTDTGSSIFVTSGATGHLYEYSNNFKRSFGTALADLRSVVASNGAVYALGNQALYVNTNGKGGFQKLASLPGLIPSSVAKMSLDGQRLYVPLNRNGLAVFNTATGKQVAQATGGTFNGVTASGSYVYAANSDGGVVVYRWADAGKTQLDELGRFQLNGMETNFIAASDRYLFVAAGNGGVRVLELTVTEN